MYLSFALDENIYDNFRGDTYMKKSKTISTLSDISELITETGLPYDMLTVIWNSLEDDDKIIFGDDSYEYLFHDIVTKGAHKNKKNKKTLKLKKSFRINFLNNNKDDDY